MKNKVIILCGILFLCCIVATFHFYQNIWLPTSKDYDTNEVKENITISYGSENSNDYSYEFSKIACLYPKEYKKINIPTECPSSTAKVPYNVWVTIDNGTEKKTSIAGYFGQNTGGLAYIKILLEDGELTLHRVLAHEKEYKQIERRNRKNQTELSWY